MSDFLSRFQDKIAVVGKNGEHTRVDIDALKPVSRMSSGIAFGSRADSGARSQWSRANTISTPNRANTIYPKNVSAKRQVSPSEGLAWESFDESTGTIAGPNDSESQTLMVDHTDTNLQQIPQSSTVQSPGMSSPYAANYNSAGQFAPRTAAQSALSSYSFASEQQTTATESSFVGAIKRDRSVFKVPELSTPKGKPTAKDIMDAVEEPLSFRDYASSLQLGRNNTGHAVQFSNDVAVMDDDFKPNTPIRTKNSSAPYAQPLQNYNSWPSQGNGAAYENVDQSNDFSGSYWNNNKIVYPRTRQRSQLATVVDVNPEYEEADDYLFAQENMSQAAPPSRYSYQPYKTPYRPRRANTAPQPIENPVPARKPHVPFPYTPYTIHDYKRLPKPILGKLGPDLDREEIVVKRQRNQNLREFSKSIRLVNAQQIMSSGSSDTQSLHSSSSPSHKNVSSRERAWQFAANVPKPVVRRKSIDPDAKEEKVKPSIVSLLAEKHVQAKDSVSAIRRELAALQGISR